MAQAEKASILIVDDNPANLHTLIDSLEQSGFETLIAMSGERAIRQLELFLPDLILLDVMMAGMDGFETCRRIKANEHTHDIPVIFMTAVSETVSKVTGFEAGGVDYIIKPFQYEELLARIHTHLTIRKLQGQLQEQNTRFRALAEATFEGIIIHAQGHILEVNQATVSLFGYQYAELLGKDVLELMSAAYRQSVAARIKAKNENPYEIEGLRKDGSIFPIEVQARQMSYQGREVRVAAARDITERKRAAQILNETIAQIERAKKEWESTADSLSYVVCLLDEHGRIIRANRTVELWGLGQVADIKGKGLHELFHPSCTEPTCSFETCLSRAWLDIAWGRPAEFEVADRTLERYLHVQLRPITDQPQEMRGDSASFAVGSVNDITERKRTEDMLRQHNHELGVLNRMSNLFQECRDEAETYHVVSVVCQELFPDEAGGLYLLDDAHAGLHLAVSWGDQQACAQLVKMTSGEEFFCSQDVNLQKELFAPHLTAAANEACLCAPLSIAEHPLGMLSLQAERRQPEDSDAKRSHRFTSKKMLLTRVAEHYALVLANLRLRETLRMEAIRDSLTSLYNRRYMEEALEREVHHAERHNTMIGIVLLDIDHFKSFNDTYGHDVGDIVLRELGILLRRHIRGEDIPCRYGGEEFLLILPEAPLETVRHRAEELRIIIRDFLNIAHQGNTLTITVSIGVAAFPDHGRNIREVVHAADTALYQAKARGRDQVAVAVC